GLVPSAASDTRRGSLAEAVFSARDTVPRSFCRPTGFSRKSKAPIFVASTAVSIVPCPDIMTTGIVSCPEAAHSRSSVTPSVSGIQMSSSTCAGRARGRRVLGEAHAVSLVLQDLGQKLADADFVVDD